VNDHLIDTFLAEAHELIVDLERGLLLLETDQQNKDGISAIFRSMHTLKGAAGMFGFESVGTITHHLESIYQEIRDGERTMNEGILRITFKTLDQLRILLNTDAKQSTTLEFDELLTAIKKLEGGEGKISETASPAATRQPATFYIYMLPKSRIMMNGTNPLFLVDDLLALGTGLSLPFFNELPGLQDITPDLCYTGFEVVLYTEKPEAEVLDVFMFVDGSCEVVIKKLSDNNCLQEIREGHGVGKGRTDHSALGFEKMLSTLSGKQKKAAAIETVKKSASAKAGNIRVSSERLDDLMNLVSELVTTQARLALFSDKNSSTELNAISENIEKITRRLRDNAFTMTLIPLESIVVRFQRLVSDLSKDLQKDIEFRAEGMDTKIDKSIMEKLTDPILHLIRNSIDHGIESKEQRMSAGKLPKGVVHLKSYYSGANVIIEISDDGAGLNLNKIKEKAIKQGLIEPHAQLSDRELADLIFIPGFSTATAVTGVSGRGVGMDVVKRNITDIRGEIETTTIAGKGTTFSIKLPLTLSILDGLLVKIGDTDFVLPLTSVAKCYEVETKQLESSFNSWITLEGKRTPFIFLRKDFGMDEGMPALSQIINVPYSGSHVGIAVDKIVGEYQAVLKPLGEFYHQQEEFSGATILGNGTVALVLDTNKLIRKLTNQL
jgi:two-component system chemotaxis sensor kinase CheA